MSNQDIIERIRQARIERKYTQQELADFIHKTGSNISEIERGKVQVNASDLLDIAKALYKPIEWFYGIESKDPLMDDMKALLRYEKPEVREQTLASINLMLSMKHKVDYLQATDTEPTETDILEFLKDFIEYSKELDRQNGEVKKIKKMLLEELKNQGLDLFQVNESNL